MMTLKNTFYWFIILCAFFFFYSCNHRTEYKCLNYSNDLLIEDVLDSLNLLSKNTSHEYLFKFTNTDSITIYCENWAYVFCLKDLDKESLNYFKHESDNCYIINIHTTNNKDNIIVKNRFEQIRTDHLTFDAKNIYDAKNVMNMICHLIYLSKDKHVK